MENKFSKNLMTKFEKTSIIGIRMEQLAFGSSSTLSEDELNKCKDIREIAEMELQTKKIPFLISRQLPNKETEQWNIKDLIIH